MTTLREAAKMALEAMLNFPDDISDEMFESITALKAALAEKALHIDTLRMAREAGFAVEDGGVYTPDAYGPGDVTQLVKRFAALVSAAEREACAAICDTTPPYPFRPSIEAAHAIRARSNT